MSSDNAFEALARRIDFIDNVGDHLGEVLDGFLQSPHGSAFKWDETWGSEQMGSVSGRIMSKAWEEADRRSTLTLRIDAHGEARIETANWYKNGEEWGSDIDERKIDLNAMDSVDDSVARVLSVIMSSRVGGFSTGLQHHVAEQLGRSLPTDPGPALGR